MSKPDNASFVDKQKARWVPDALSTSCARCGAAWTVFRRKHHCRRCYQVFCDACSPARVLLQGYGTEPQRVCKICEAILAGSTAAAIIGADGRVVYINNSNNAGASAVASASASPSGSQAAGGAQQGKTSAGSKAGSPAGAEERNAAAAKPLPSLEVFPRERRVLLVGSAGVGKGSFVATACGPQSISPYTVSGNAPASAAAAAASSSQQQQHFHSLSSPANSPSGDNEFGGASGAAGGGAGGGGGAASSAPTERRRLIPYQGQLYSLTLVNTAGSTVSSDLFVHPLLTIGTSAYVLMYDVTEPKSFELLPLLYERLLDCGAGDKAIMLLGSKADHVSQTGAGRDRVVSKEQALRLARSWGAPHVDCACTSKDSVDQALTQLLQEISSRDTF